jgi:hypothetical protein
MDNHESQCTLKSILCALENGIEIVTFPPRCSHRLIPLDVGVMRKFKGKLRLAQHDWITANPGKAMSILHRASMNNAAYQAVLRRRIKEQLLLRVVHGNSYDLPPYR